MPYCNHPDCLKIPPQAEFCDQHASMKDTNYEVRATSVKEEWCEHIFKEEETNVWIFKPRSVVVDKESKFCSYCGKPRPEKLKRLWEILKESDSECSGIHGSNHWRILAQAAKEVFREVIEGERCYQGRFDLICKSELIKKLEAL